MRVVQKYGGTSVATPERLRAVADRVAATRAAGAETIVVVSAMGDTTDELLALATRVTGRADVARVHPRETDMLLSAGERIAMALLAMALRERGVPALSLTGSQAAIITDERHTAARIVEVRADRVRAALAEGAVPIVAGFQGVSRRREITTLGRGGSDTTAAALAVALAAQRCEIYTDVDGVYSADPRRVPDAVLRPRLRYDEAVELAAAGAVVVHPRAVEIAARGGVPVWVGSSFGPPIWPPSGGTWIDDGKTIPMEEFVLTGLASTRAYARLRLAGLPLGMDLLAELLGRLADAGVSVDMLWEAPDGADRRQLHLTVREDDLSAARTALAPWGEPEVLAGLARLAMVGSGMHDRPGVYAQAYRALAAAEVPVHAVSTSAISITMLVPADREDAALRSLHSAFADALRREEVRAVS